MKKGRVQVCFRTDPNLKQWLDDLAGAHGLSQNQAINLIVSKAKREAEKGVSPLELGEIN